MLIHIWPCWSLLRQLFCQTRTGNCSTGWSYKRQQQATSGKLWKVTSSNTQLFRACTFYTLLPAGAFPAQKAAIPEALKWVKMASLSHYLSRLYGFRKPPLLHFAFNSLLHGWSHKQEECRFRASDCVPQVLWNSPSEVMLSSPWQSLPWCILNALPPALMMLFPLPSFRKKLCSLQATSGI